MQKQMIIPFLMCHIQIYFSVPHRYMHFSNILCVFDVILEEWKLLAFNNNSKVEFDLCVFLLVKDCLTSFAVSLPYHINLCLKAQLTRGLSDFV